MEGDSLLLDGYLSKRRRRCKIFELFYQKEISKRFSILLLGTVAFLTCLTALIGMSGNFFHFSPWKCLLVAVCWGSTSCLLIHCYRNLFCKSGFALVPSLSLFPYMLASDLLLVWLRGTGNDYFPVVYIPHAGYQMNDRCFILLIHAFLFAVAFVVFGRLKGKFRVELPLLNARINLKLFGSKSKAIAKSSVIFSAVFSTVFCFVYSVIEKFVQMLLKSTLSSLFIMPEHFWSEWVPSFVNLRALWLSLLLSLFATLTWGFIQLLFDIFIMVDPSFHGKQLELGYSVGCLQESDSNIMRLFALLEMRALLYKDAAMKPAFYSQKYKNDLQELFDSLTQFCDQFSKYLEHHLKIMQHAKSAEQFVEAEPHNETMEPLGFVPECLRVPVGLQQRKVTSQSPEASKLRPALVVMRGWNECMFVQHDFVVLMLQVCLATLGIFRMENEVEIEKPAFQQFREKLVKVCGMLDAVHALPTIGFGLGVPYRSIYGPECVSLLEQCISTVTKPS